MVENALISYLGENKPNLISDVTNYLTEQGGEFSGVTFATLGRVCELTMVYQVSKNENAGSLKEDLSSLKSVKNGEFTVKDIPTNSVLLTFDDGLKDHFQFVFPELKKHGISGVFFPPSLPIEENIVLDVHKIHFILESVSDPSKIIKEIKLFIILLVLNFLHF